MEKRKFKWWPRSKDRTSLPKKDRPVVCENCRTEIPGNINLCPKCGLSPGPQTITDLPGFKREKAEEEGK